MAAMRVVRNLDLERYAGRWYEIACFPSTFQPKTGTNTRATYTLNPDGTVKVLNETWTDGGRRGHIEGTAWRADPASDEAKLKVRFYVPPFLPVIPVTGDYWVLHVDADYQYALVGQPSRKYLWVRANSFLSGLRSAAVRPSLAGILPTNLSQCFPSRDLRPRLICVFACVCRSFAGSLTWRSPCTTSWWSVPRRKGTTCRSSARRRTLTRRRRASRAPGTAGCGGSSPSLASSQVLGERVLPAAVPSRRAHT
jgi:lipocalin